MNQTESAALDAMLMSQEIGYSLEQLMEMAGLGIALCITNWNAAARDEKLSFLFMIGPGNNGGDGLVCARYLKLFLGLKVHVTCCLIEGEKAEKKFGNLLNLLGSFNVKITSFESIVNEQFKDDCVVIVDCVFGFSFRPPLRGVYKEAIEWMSNFHHQMHHRNQLISVDIPSGWHVENGPIPPSTSSSAKPLNPDVIISLSAPKLNVSASKFQGAHYVTGRFVPPVVAERLNIAQSIPEYPGDALYVRL